MLQNYIQYETYFGTLLSSFTSSYSPAAYSEIFLFLTFCCSWLLMSLLSLSWMLSFSYTMFSFYSTFFLLIKVLDCCNPEIFICPPWNFLLNLCLQLTISLTDLKHLATASFITCGCLFSRKLKRKTKKWQLVCENNKTLHSVHFFDHKWIFSYVVYVIVTQLLTFGALFVYNVIYSIIFYLKVSILK